MEKESHAILGTFYLWISNTEQALDLGPSTTGSYHCLLWESPLLLAKVTSATDRDEV